MAYSKEVVQRFEDVLKNPHKHSVGRFDPNDPNVATGMVGAPSCGDVMKLQIKVNDFGEIVDAKFKTFGCGSAIASSSYTTELIKGLHINEAINVTNSNISKYLNLPPVKLHCSMLAEAAIKHAIKDFKKKTD